MGLIVSKQIIEASNGQLHFVSETNIGSSFAFSFEIEVIDNNDIGKQVSSLAIDKLIATHDDERPLNNEQLFGSE